MSVKDVKCQLIGKTVEGTYNGVPVTGKIVDETKETLKIESENKSKVFLKNNLTITKINDHAVNIDGDKIRARPFERIRLR